MPTLGGVKILIAGVNPAIASGLSLMLKQWGVGACKAVFARAELVAALSDDTHNNVPDVVLFNIDIVGGVDDLGALLRRHSVSAIGLAARFLTSDWEMQDEVAVLEMPFGIDELQSAILSALRRTSEGITP